MCMKQVRLCLGLARYWQAMMARAGAFQYSFTAGCVQGRTTVHSVMHHAGYWQAMMAPGLDPKLSNAITSSTCTPNQFYPDCCASVRSTAMIRYMATSAYACFHMAGHISSLHHLSRIFHAWSLYLRLSRASQGQGGTVV